MFKLVLRLLIALSLCCCFATALSSAQLPVEARNAEGSSEEEEVISSSYVLPNQIFNNGKPYYASKDPVSGQLDFNLKKPAGIDAAVNEVVDPNEKAVISSSSPNIHDFLNLPVKYSPSKFVYPLVSSSYANLKYQGSNKNYITNKKPTQVAQSVKNKDYHMANYYTVPTTKLTLVDSILPALTSSSTSTASSGNSTTTTKKPTTIFVVSSSTFKPTTSASTTTPTRSTSIITTRTPTTTTFNTTKAAAVETHSSLQPTNNNQQFTASTRKPTQPATTEILMTTTTHKKFIPSKKYSTKPTTTPAQTTSSGPLRFPDWTPLNTTASPTKPTNSSMLEFNHPTKPSTTRTTQTIVFTEDPSAPPPFSPFPSSTQHIPIMDPADVYHSLDQKYSEMKYEQKPTMTLADIFNSLVEEESAVAANNPMNQGLDAQGNLMEPLDPSKPSPFAVQQHEVQKQTLPAFESTDRPHNSQQQPPLQLPTIPQQQPGVTTNNQENFSNEYVSYQVQQPNILQYRPAPGAINNVVISPGQSSASFVLGSQQKVGQNAFGSVEKEPLFSKEHHVQYGTVINEDINGIKRQPMPSTPNTYQEVPTKTSVSNFHQNGIFAASQESKHTEIPTRPLPSTYKYPELPPAPPSPYQQLPLVGNIRHKPSNSDRQKSSTLPPTVQSQSLLPSANPNGLSQSPNPQNSGDGSIASGSHQDTKELLVSTNIRFPANDEPSAEMPSLPVENGPPAGPQVNGHAQPLSLQQIQNSNPVVFPKHEDANKPQQNDLIYHNKPNANAESIQIQKQEVLTMSQHQQKLAFPSNENPPYTPAQHMVPPPLPNTATADHELQKLNRPHGNSQYTYNEYTRKPIPGITRPNPDRHLPNILPQFRPNAKISSGHPQQAAFNQEPGNIRVTGAQQPKRGALSGNPQFSHRRQPLGGQPKRYPLTRMADYPAGLPSPNEMANRRVYRVSPYGGASAQYLERPGLHVRRPLPQNLRTAESVNVERHAFAPALEKLPAFEEEDLVINDPPQPVTATKENSLFNEAKLEPVVTLQMLQSHKKPVSLPSEDSGDGEIQVPGLDNEETDLGVQDVQNGLYVVYPIKGGQKSENIDAENKNILPAVAHVEPSTGSEYQNTPFSIIRDYQQEPVLKNKKPLSLQQHNKVQQTRDSFPYPIEKPDPAYGELKANTKIPGVIIAPKITNGFYGSATETPIAIAYTPTEASRPPVPANHKQKFQQQPQSQQQQQQTLLYSNVNLATPVIKEIRPNDKTEQTLNGHDFDLRAQNYEKDFMAPFYPSVSLDSVTITPTNGWNILPTSTDHTLYEKKQINRSDVGSGEAKDKMLPESSTKSFELDKFQPELQGGFKPIYPPGYKLDNDNGHDKQEQLQQQQQQHITNNTPLALALANHMDAPQKLKPLSPETKANSTSSSTTSTTTTIKPLKNNNPEQSSTDSITNPTEKLPPLPTKPTKRTKSKFETSLAALLFGEDEEDAAAVEDTPVEQTQGRQEPVKAMLSGPRSMPRMGPRSLKI